MFSAGFLDDFVGVEDKLGLAGFTFKVGKFVVAAAGAFSDAGAFGGFDVKAATEEGDESPVMTLFDFGSDGMVMALGALDLFSEEGTGDAGGDFAVVIKLIVNEPRGAAFLIG